MMILRAILFLNKHNSDTKVTSNITHPKLPNSNNKALVTTHFEKKKEKKGVLSRGNYTFFFYAIWKLHLINSPKIGISKFNHLINTLTLLLTCGFKLPVNR
jgi:hypothetical protein